MSMVNPIIVVLCSVAVLFVVGYIAVQGGVKESLCAFLCFTAATVTIITYNAGHGNLVAMGFTGAVALLMACMWSWKNPLNKALTLLLILTALLNSVNFYHLFK
jgi:hypothetical protein